MTLVVKFGIMYLKFDFISLVFVAYNKIHVKN